GVVGAGDVDRLVDLVVAVEPLQQVAVAVAGDEGVDVLEDADDGPLGLDPAELLHAADEGRGFVAEEGEVAVGDDAGDDLVDQRRLAAALLAVEQVAAAVQEAVPAKALAHRPESADFAEDARRQAVGEVDQVIDVQLASLELAVAVAVRDA